MTSYFNTKERVLKLREEAFNWVGTPFADCSAVPGPRGGVSCGYLVLNVLLEAGDFNIDYEMPRIGWKDNHGRDYSTINALLKVLVLQGVVVPIDLRDLFLPGDILGIRINSCLDHLALYLSPSEVLSIRIGRRAQIGTFAGCNLVEVWRPVEKSY